MLCIILEQGSAAKQETATISLESFSRDVNYLKHNSLCLLNNRAIVLIIIK